MSEIIKMAFIGNGKSANRYHIPFVLTRRDKFQVKYIYRRNPAHDSWAKIPEATYTTDLEQVLQDAEVRLVVISTQQDSHYEYAKKVLLAGKHCLVEKPFMVTVDEAKEIFALAESRGLYCSPCQNRRYDSDFLTVQKVIASGRLGELLEVEMHYDYYRPEVPEGVHSFDPAFSYLYGHGCHTLDQVLSYWGKPERVHYDVRQLLGPDRMNDYFDIDLYYGRLKVSVKSSYFRVKERPSFVVYGKKGVFVKLGKDKQEADLKKFYLPEGHADFGLDQPEDYSVLSYYDAEGHFHEEKVESVRGDYARIYDDIYAYMVHGKPQVITHEQTLWQMEMLEEGIRCLMEQQG
jgi:predicted dehydrogenase